MSGLKVTARLLIAASAILLSGAILVPWYLTMARASHPEAAATTAPEFLVTMGMVLWRVLPYVIGLYVAGHGLILLVDTRTDVQRIAQRLDELHPPERS